MAQGKEVMHDQIQSQIMADQLLELLSPNASQVFELQRKLYTWKSADRHQEEMDSPTVFAVIYYMFSKIEKVKNLTLSQFGNNFGLWRHQESKITHLSILQHTQRQSFCLLYIFKQLWLAPVDSFRLTYECAETQWLMGKVVINSASLMNKVSLYFFLESRTWQ